MPLWVSVCRHWCICYSVCPCFCSSENVCLFVVATCVSLYLCSLLCVYMFEDPCLTLLSISLNMSVVSLWFSICLSLFVSMNLFGCMCVSLSLWVCWFGIPMYEHVRIYCCDNFYPVCLFFVSVCVYPCVCLSMSVCLCVCVLFLWKCSCSLLKITISLFYFWFDLPHTIRLFSIELTRLCNW